MQEVYTGVNASKTRDILKKYDIDYIIIGQVERAQYNASLKLDKLKKFGTVVFNNKEAMIVKVK